MSAVSAEAWLVVYDGSIKSRLEVLRSQGYGRTRTMATAARDRLARTLRGDAQTAFSVEMTARTDDLSLEVEGFGSVKFPVTPAKARKLLGLGQPWRGDAERPGCPRHVGDPETPRPRRVERRHAEGHPRDGKRRARTTERCRTDCRSSLAPGVRAEPVLPRPPGLREKRLDDRHPGGDPAVQLHRRRADGGA